MTTPFTDDAPIRRQLSQSLREVRRRRGLSSSEVARGMNMALRSYQHFERGRGRLTYDLLRRFGAAADCDPRALLIGALFGVPQLPILSIDNKFTELLLGELEDFVAGDAIGAAALEGAMILSALRRFFDELRALSRQHQLRARVQADGRLAPSGTWLTARQTECLRWVQAGKSSTDIGVILGISQRTVDDHLLAACRRLGVRTRVQAVATAQALGILQPYP
jgi:DNA-binding CsgD family transcriptional regulator